MKKLQQALRIMCLISLGANIVVMGIAWYLASLELLMLGACSSILVLFGYLYGDIAIENKDDE